MSSLDQLLKNLGLPIDPNGAEEVEGYISESQRIQFCEKLKEYSPIKSIAEIGLNAGHSAENFLKYCPEIKKFVSFDICNHEYTNLAVNYLKETYQDQFHFICGNSTQTVSEYALDNPNHFFDLIYIDGDHSYETCVLDINNCAKIAKKGTKLWIDDYCILSVFLAIHTQILNGLIRIINIHKSQDNKGRKRCWVEAEYIFKN